jgi:hypothetical protein
MSVTQGFTFRYKSDNLLSSLDFSPVTLPLHSALRVALRNTQSLLKFGCGKNYRYSHGCVPPIPGSPVSYRGVRDSSTLLSNEQETGSGNLWCVPEGGVDHKGMGRWGMREPNDCAVDRGKQGGDPQSLRCSN